MAGCCELVKALLKLVVGLLRLFFLYSILLALANDPLIAMTACCAWGFFVNLGAEIFVVVSMLAFLQILRYYWWFETLPNCWSPLDAVSALLLMESIYLIIVKRGNLRFHVWVRTALYSLYLLSIKDLFDSSMGEHWKTLVRVYLLASFNVGVYPETTTNSNPPPYSAIDPAIDPATAPPSHPTTLAFGSSSSPLLPSSLLSPRSPSETKRDRIANVYSATIEYLEGELCRKNTTKEQQILQVCLAEVKELAQEWHKDPKQPPVPPSIANRSVLTEYQWDEIELGDYLGGGAEGEVRKAELDDQEVAVKVLFSDTKNEEAIRLWKGFVPHSNVATLQGLVKPTLNRPHYGLITNYYPFGALDNLPFPPSTETCRKIFTQIASGLAHLHRQNIVHQDLARRNVLVSKTGRVVLTDFGLSVRLPDSHSKIVSSSQQRMSLEMLAPEVCDAMMEKRKVTTSPRRDMWALGVVIWETVMHQSYALQWSMLHEALYDAVLKDAVLPVRDIVLKVGSVEPRIVVTLIGCKLPKEARLTAEEVRAVLWKPEDS